MIPALHAIAVWGTRVRSLVPLGWQRDPILTNLWRSPEMELNEGRISFTWVVGETGPQALQRLGLTVPLTAQGSQQAGGRTWQLYASPQNPVQVATTTDGQDTYLIAVESLRQRSRQAILQGAIAGFQLAPAIAVPPKP
jgi:hypothetical protein